MLTDLEIDEAVEKLKTVSTAEDLKKLKDTFLGNSGLIKQALSVLKQASMEHRRQEGPRLQAYKARLEAALAEAEARISVQAISSKMQAEASSLPFQVPKVGHLHPLTQTIRDMNRFFERMGYSIYDGPEVENDEFNFLRLNVPKDHPARDMQDTIYIDAPNILLRTQTSAIEARALAALKPPFRIVSAARVYRNEKPSKTNHFIFNQYQAVVVQERVTLAELFGTLEMLFKHMYGEKVVMRFRSKYYPEVEPGVGPDMRCFNCEGKGCAVCKHVGWIEMGGAGIIHEDILSMAGIDPKKYMGFAFGLGLDRWVMAKYNITDIRTLLGGDLAYPYFEHEKTVI